MVARPRNHLYRTFEHIGNLLPVRQRDELHNVACQPDAVGLAVKANINAFDEFVQNLGCFGANRRVG